MYITATRGPIKGNIDWRWCMWPSDKGLGHFVSTCEGWIAYGTPHVACDPPSDGVFVSIKDTYIFHTLLPTQSDSLLNRVPSLSLNAANKVLSVFLLFPIKD